MRKPYEYSNEAMCLAVAAASDVGVLAATLEELSCRSEPMFEVDGRMGMFISALTRHDSARVREAALEVIGKRRMHASIEAAYQALLRDESPAIWSTAAYAISQCPDQVDRDGKQTVRRHYDIVEFRIRHVGNMLAYLRQPGPSCVLDRLDEALTMLVRAGATPERHVDPWGSADP